MNNNNCGNDCQCEPIKCVCCEVDNCKYNDGKCHCTAHDITVKSKMSILNRETMCDTFEEK